MQFSSIVATSVLQLPSFFAQAAGERAEEQSGQGVVRLLECFQNIILSRTHQPVPIIVQLFFSVSTFKVLLDGIYDEDSTLHKLRSPRCVVEDVMPIVWEHLTWDWQVGLNFQFHDCILLIVISKTKYSRCTTRTMVAESVP